MQFKIEQIAICPANPEAAIALLTAMGAAEWAKDHVVANGRVYGQEGRNEADLAFNYDMFGGKEFEVLNYTEGNNWMLHPERINSVSHLGMHTTEEELALWKEFFAERSIAVAQEVFTESHTNPFLVDNGRKYHYCIFDTKGILGVDLKFICRKEHG